MYIDEDAFFSDVAVDGPNYIEIINGYGIQ